MLTTHDNVVTQHYLALFTFFSALRDDHLDLVRSVEGMKGFSTNMSHVMEALRIAVGQVQGELAQRELVPIQQLQQILMLNTIKLQTQVFYGQFRFSFHDAHLAFRINFLPGSMVPQEKLKRDLEDLSQNLMTDGFELTLPATRISTYYSLPISSCMFSSRETVATVRVPFKRRGDSWKLVEYLPSPLAWWNYTCSMSDKAMFVAVS